MQRQASDAIRIVPLNPPDITAAAAAAAPATAPQLTYRGGPLLAAVEVFALFWGSAWKTTNADMVIAANQFFDFILTSALMDQLGEYSTTAARIGQGVHTGSAVIDEATPASVSDADLRALLQRQLRDNSAVPKPNANSLYFIFLPSNVTVSQGGAHSCQDFCGYHDADGNVYYAVMPYPGCTGCTGSLSVNDALTVTASHELCEAITDPVPGQGWYDDSNGEIGDICAWQTKKIGAYTVQLEWSNQANACV